MRIYGSLRLAVISFAAATIAATLLAGCSSLSAFFEGEDANLALKGNDPVAYFTAGRPAPGSQDIKAQHDGMTFRFTSEENRRLFITNPARYAPQFDGFGAAGMVYAIPGPGEPDSFKIIDGKLYLFASARAKLYFEMDQERNLRLAWNYWDSEVKDSNRHLQALKRTVFHVPNYKSETDLAAEYERRFGRKPG